MYPAIGTFFPRMTAPGSPWMTMYLVGPRKRPVGARNPGSSKSFMMLVISSGLNCITASHHVSRTRPIRSAVGRRRKGENE